MPAATHTESTWWTVDTDRGRIVVPADSREEACNKAEEQAARFAGAEVVAFDAHLLGFMRPADGAAAETCARIDGAPMSAVGADAWAAGVSGMAAARP